MIITAGIYKGRKVVAPDEKITRPTLSKIRECIFSTLFSMIDFQGKSFLDCFAGSGIMGLEAISRGFEGVVAMEKNPKVARILKENYTNLKIPPDFLFGDSLKIIPKITRQFDVIYLDPPYQSGIYEETLKKIKENNLLKEGAIIVLEHSVDVSWQECGFELIKQKRFADKLVTFLR